MTAIVPPPPALPHVKPTVAAQVETVIGHPLGQYLPSVMQGDDLTSRWMAGIDDLMLPIVWIIDAMDSYSDPTVAPTDMLPWLADWVGAEVRDDLPLDKQRRLLADTSDLHGRRGTIGALRQIIEAATEAVVVEISDGGGVSWSAVPREPMPDRTRSTLLVRVRASAAEALRVENLVQEWCPAHVSHCVEIIDP